MVKNIHEKSKVYIKFNGKILTPSPYYKQKEWPLLLFQVSILIEVLAKVIIEGKYIKWIQIGNKEVPGPLGTPLVVQWLRLCSYNVGGEGSIPDWGIKIPCAVQHGQEKKKQKRKHGPLDFLSHWMASSSIVIWIIHGTVFFLTKISNHSTIWLFYLQNLSLQAFILSSLHIYYP